MASFDQLQSLIQILDQHGQQPLPLLGKLVRRPGKETTLFENIQKGVYTSDEQAVADLYGVGKAGKQYAMLKARLYEKLLNHLFFLDFTAPHPASYLTFERESLSLLYQANMLISISKYELAETLLNRSFKIAKELGFTAVCVACLQQWRYVHIRHTREKAFARNQQLLEHYRAIAECEWEADDLYFSYRLIMNTPVDTRKKYLPKLLMALPRLKNLWEQSRSPAVFNQYYKLNIWYHELIGDFKAIIQITTESDQLLQQQVIHPLRFDDRYNKFIQVYAYLRVKKFEKGLELAEKYLLSMYHPSINNWFAYMENYLLMAMHAQQYDLALQLMKQVTSNLAFEKLTKLAKEKWTLYQAYLYCIHSSEESLQKFDYQKFTQAVTSYSKDKQGFNVAILILQFLHDLQTKDLRLLGSRVESVKKYMTRHLAHKEAQRSRYFLRLLILAVEQELNPDRCRKKGTKLLEKLVNAPTPGDAHAEIEIIPYEHLWEFVLRNLLEASVK